jgi:hypothetical protein
MRKLRLASLLLLFAFLFFAASSTLAKSPSEGPVTDGEKGPNVCKLYALISSQNAEKLNLNKYYYRVRKNSDDLCDIDGWKVTLEGSIGMSSKIKVNCESGGNQDCPLLVWCDEDDSPEDNPNS